MDARGQASNILSDWQIVIRDMLLKNIGAEDVAASGLVLKKIKNFNIPTEKLLNINNILEKSKQYLEANVMPKLVLENISLQI